MLPKNDLIRIVRTPGGIQIDETGKLSGRGTYLHKNKSCWEKGISGAVSRALKKELTDQEKQLFKEYLSKLHEE